MHKNCYGDRGAHTVKRGLTFGSTAAEKKSIRAEVERFADQIADAAEAYLSVHQLDRIDDLILTGGGTLIPAIRTKLCERIGRYGPTGAGRKLVAHTYESSEFLPPSVVGHQLGYETVRGATAIGGASIYFDFAHSG